MKSEPILILSYAWNSEKIYTWRLQIVHLTWQIKWPLKIQQKSFFLAISHLDQAFSAVTG